MASLATEIPLDLMHRNNKLAVLKHIQRQPAPSRTKRQMLQDWGDATGADLNGTDYAIAGGDYPGEIDETVNPEEIGGGEHTGRMGR